MPTPPDYCDVYDCTQPVPCEVHGHHPSQVGRIPTEAFEHYGAQALHQAGLLELEGQIGEAEKLRNYGLELLLIAAERSA
jgi:hypothetical protein